MPPSSPPAIRPLGRHASYELPAESPLVKTFRRAYERGGTRTIVAIVTVVSTVVSLLLTGAAMKSAGVDPAFFPMGLGIAGFVPLVVSPLVTLAFTRMTAHLLALETFLSELATRDVLTGAHNRRWIMDKCLARAGAVANRNSRPSARAAGGILMVDIDHFKSINDRHGHPVGDRVLRAAAQTLGATLRSSDAFGRYGGEEFLVLTSDRDDKALGRSAEALRRAIERMVADPERPELKVTASLGAALLPGTGGETALATTLQQADAALYRAKAGGRNRVVVDGIAASVPVPTGAGPALNDTALAAGT